MWDLWWTKWRWGRVSPSTSVSPANLHSTNFSTITITYHLGLVQWATSGRSTNRLSLTPLRMIIRKLYNIFFNLAMADSLKFQHQNPSALSIQDSPIHSECTLVQDPWDLQKNTVLSEIENKWGNTKYVRKCGIHTNSLAVYLLDNSGTTCWLKEGTPS
jgi:hypothetical protein